MRMMRCIEREPLGKSLSKRTLAAIACSIIVASGSTTMSMAVTEFG
jgi:hypothetical protein